MTKDEAELLKPGTLLEINTKEGILDYSGIERKELPKQENKEYLLFLELNTGSFITTATVFYNNKIARIALWHLSLVEEK